MWLPYTPQGRLYWVASVPPLLRAISAFSLEFSWPECCSCSLGKGWIERGFTDRENRNEKRTLSPPRPAARSLCHRTDGAAVRDLGRRVCRHQDQHPRHAASGRRRGAVLPHQSGPASLGALSAC